MNGIYQKSLKNKCQDNKKISFAVQQFTSDFIIQVFLKSFLSLLSKVDMKKLCMSNALLSKALYFVKINKSEETKSIKNSSRVGKN